MNKAELIDSIAKKAELTKAQSKKALDAFIDSTHDALKSKKDGRVALVGFGTFRVAKRAARTGRNPKTKAAIKIPAKHVVRFKVGSDLSKAINK
ncbi:MAG: HU family DNA-binding protein [Bacteroidia bacterium]|nr:HU family DNA-binding protein [Bacteroidia bacterium]